MIERDNKTFSVISQKPEFTSSEDSRRLILEAIEGLQKVERNYMGREEITVGVKTNDSLMLVCGADLHIGSLATDHKSVLHLRDFVLNNSNAGLILLGDEVEGLKEKYMNTNTARTPIDFHKQIDFIREEILSPLAEKGKILGMVSGYWGHNGWAEDATTINTWMMLAEGYGIPILQNGGRLNIKFPNNYVHSETIWHNPPGKSRFDTVYGLRNAAFATSESSRSDGYMSGHIHRMGVGKELYSGAKSSVYFISSGTAKGSSESIPNDRFGIKLGAPRTDPLGQGVIIEPRRKNQKEKNYPFASFEQGEMANNALDLLDWTEKKGITAELLEKIRKEVESKPKISLVSGKSRVSGDENMEDTPAETVKVDGAWVTNPYSKMEMRAPYDSLTYNIETKLPVTLHILSNARLGSSSEGFDDLKKYHQEQIEFNPHSLVVFLRNMIDKDAGSSPQRMEILNKYKEIINGAKSQTLAIMMCESLRSNAWKKKIKIGEEDYEDDEENEKVKKSVYSMPIAPGSYLAKETNTPLIHHLSLIKLTIGPKGPISEKPMYSGAFADKLMKHGSYSRPEFGLQRMYDLYTQEKPGFVAGGHMPHAGSMMFYDGSNAETNTPILVAPGWFAKYVNTMGKGNVMPGALPGQAIIFMPGSSKTDYLAFPTVSADETGYMQDAFTLFRGLELMGLTDKVLGRRRR
ncbi:TPA: hypothetical protein DCP77_01550 [Candidatus Collierbacteria bacterium]|uniref:Uncharacterized protein n=1 Tax=Candidatus Collierbacteria bacterium GW2011_GWA2_42_17 TaxID=1618378 RepID=A0A0G0Z1H5_9BACT|nr:MAG: hypothetical protein UU94_C0009G0015 [Candidatus Collierbacteria bacterium GW2011_GWB2_42_12]KKS42604.1 MAG: hypothetical protein UV06_C0009G0024 [Candidatus Collierbacteria bacterium GW2011_GWA2_42_17]KKS62613.1 MAG: hypothetical protein UV29_C0013G0017 [Candidatus Collierbacteria bacterium GW2011_GWD2_42_50]KKS62644.1 MAG: hypothetical protein UV28_C0007G0014 [Candidatus Collierbacteria bacterium GW2011_GWE2_42_48]KKS64621.1 MAG: hypothetical protein UV32_C0010G0004 [Candidatus Collie